MVDEANDLAEELDVIDLEQDEENGIFSDGSFDIDEFLNS